MRIIYNNIIPVDGFVAVNLFGVLFVRKKYKEMLDTRHEYKTLVVNHESIHTEQMKELLYIGFYVMYAIYYLILLFRYGKTLKAYKMIPFEQEAYNNERDIEYLSHRKRYAFLQYGLWRKSK